MGMEWEWKRFGVVNGASLYMAGWGSAWVGMGPGGNLSNQGLCKIGNKGNTNTQHAVENYTTDTSLKMLSGSNFFCQ